jgi:UDP-glucuronate 4-epimerase
MKILVTGAAGFIGYFTAQRLLARGDEVVGMDNLNEYYDVGLKLARLSLLQKSPQFRFLKIDLTDRQAVDSLFAAESIQRVIHLGAQAGVRHSLTDPHSYVSSNVAGTLVILEACRHHHVEHLVYASTSSVYGASTRMPFTEQDPACHPLSLYAATKRSTELMAHSYAALFGLPVTGLRFFTVYGPWGRPDMALFKFAKAMLEGKPIEIFNHGRHRRDFTYVDDIVDGIVRITDHIATPDPQWQSGQPDPASSRAPFRLYNIGSSRPVELMRYIEVLETCLGVRAQKVMLPMQQGDVPDTFADVSRLMQDIGYHPQTSVETGVPRFADWFRDYYGYR